MSEQNSVKSLMDALRSGEDEAAQAVWQHYFHSLVTLARRKFGNLPRREADEEDVVLSAMNSFLHGVKGGQFSQLDNRDDLWKLLVTITARKVSTQMKRHFAAKRGDGEVRGESVFSRPGQEGEAGLGQILGTEPTPEFAAEMSETCEALLDQLDDEVLRAIALLRLQGYTNAEIAQTLSISHRAVERKLGRIRSKWAKEEAS